MITAVQTHFTIETLVTVASIVGTVAFWGALFYLLLRRNR